MTSDSYITTNDIAHTTPKTLRYEVSYGHFGTSAEVSGHFGTSGVVANIYLAERMASAEHEPITGVWGQSPQQGPGAEPLVGVRAAKPP